MNVEPKIAATKQGLRSKRRWGRPAVRMVTPGVPRSNWLSTLCELGGKGVEINKTTTQGFEGVNPFIPVTPFTLQNVLSSRIGNTLILSQLLPPSLCVCVRVCDYKRYQ